MVSIFKKIFVILFCTFLFSAISYAQKNFTLAPYSAWNMAQLYIEDSINNHTVWKPILYLDSAQQHYMHESWLKRKSFDEHFLILEKEGVNIYADFIPDSYLGRTKRFLKSPNINMNTRGFRVFGNSGRKFYFETELYENQAQFPGYVDSFIRKIHVIPQIINYRNLGDGAGFDFSYSSSRIFYTPSSHFFFDLGYGKNFIGDGYRSMILSDWSSNYPYLRATTEWGKLQYSAMWSNYISKVDLTQNNKLGYQRKWGQTYLLDWKATKHFTIGIFETVIWPDQDSLHRKDMSWSVLSPVIFLHGQKTPAGIFNNSISGINAKYKITSGTFLYSQFAVQGFGSSNSWKNKYAFQAGVRSGNIFMIKNLNLLTEVNLVKPYMYAGESDFVNNTHFSQPLADPMGANFKEGILVADYRYKNWWFRVEGIVAKYGADSSSTVNYGHDIFKPLSTQTIVGNGKIGQGVASNYFFADVKVAYIFNPKTNLRLETGFTYRKDSNHLKTYNDQVFYIGIRSSFRNLFYDF